MNPTVSIIVPVYNAEKTLKRCVDSILGQEYEDFELILVDDGSTDGSGSLCDAFGNQDSRVRVIHKENGGVSDSRNMGLKLARGKWLQFADSDDWVTADATRLLVRKAEADSCDMVVADFYRVIGDRVSHKGDIEEDQVLSREEYAAYMMENPSDYYYGVLWNKLYRRELVERYGLRMNTEISWCEDFLFNLEYIRRAERFGALRTPVYYYVKTKGSLVSQSMSISKVVKTKLTMFEYYNNFYKHVLDEEDYEKNRVQMYRFLLDVAGDGFLFPAGHSAPRKLGEERGLVVREAIGEDGVLMEAYRNRKLLEHYLAPAAFKYDLSMAELSVLMYINGKERILSRKKLADLTDLSISSLLAALQKLTAKKLITAREEPRKKGEERQIRIAALPAANAVLADLKRAEQDFYEARFQGFTKEELKTYCDLEETVKRNIRRVLQ